jgi:hypothetical protein
MKKICFLLILMLGGIQAKAWWDHGHMVTAMIAYLNLNKTARAKVDSLTAVLARDYPQVNHFIATGPWPDDIKADGVHAYDSWHYTDVPFNLNNIAVPGQPEVDIIWAINQCTETLKAPQSKALEKARFLSFLVHFVSDLHQPLHSTSRFSNDVPGGDSGGNLFQLKGNWRNLHALWDDGCGYLSSYGDIRPFGKPKEPLTEAQIERVKDLAKDLMKKYPEKDFNNLETLDPDFWALESHKLSKKYVYGVKGKDDKGRNQYLMPNDEPTPFYLEQGQEVVRKQLALSGYRLAAMLNELFGEKK